MTLKHLVNLKRFFKLFIDDGIDTASEKYASEREKCNHAAADERRCSNVLITYCLQV